MEAPAVNQLVKVATGGPPLDGIVVDVPSEHKVVVALVDSRRGPVYRTVDADAVSVREQEGPQDRALHALIRRTPHTARGAGGGAGGPVQGRRGHSHPTMHRTTGK
jgi:hypothetical protein